MKRQRSVLLAAAMACLLAAGTALAAAPSSSKPKKPPKLTPDELREVNKLLGDFRAARGDLEARGEICKQVLAVGPGAVPLMSAAIQREAAPATEALQRQVPGPGRPVRQEEGRRRRPGRSGTTAEDGARHPEAGRRLHQRSNRPRRRSGHAAAGAALHYRPQDGAGAVRGAGRRARAADRPGQALAAVPVATAQAAGPGRRRAGEIAELRGVPAGRRVAGGRPGRAHGPADAQHPGRQHPPGRETRSRGSPARSWPAT